MSSERRAGSVTNDPDEEGGTNDLDELVL